MIEFWDEDALSREKAKFFCCWATVHSHLFVCIVAQMLKKNILLKDILFYSVGGGGYLL